MFKRRYDALFCLCFKKILSQWKKLKYWNWKLWLCWRIYCVPVPSLEHTKWVGTSRKCGEALKWSELSHIKTGILRLQIMRSFKNLYSCLKKERYKAGSVCFVCQIIVWKICLQKCDQKRKNASRSATRIRQRGKELNQKYFFSTKLSNLDPKLNKPMQFKCITGGPGNEAPSRWVIFVILRQK